MEIYVLALYQGTTFSRAENVPKIVGLLAPANRPACMDSRLARAVFVSQSGAFNPLERPKETRCLPTWDLDDESMPVGEFALGDALYAFFDHSPACSAFRWAGR
jgi:hypothetical protein